MLLSANEKPARGLDLCLSTRKVNGHKQPKSLKMNCDRLNPIIIVGKSRSGTKWLTNILCNHGQIFGVQSERSRGVLETDLFRDLEEKFDLDYPDDYAAFLEMWSKSEFFIACSGDKDAFYSMTPRPRSFYELFDILMNQGGSDGGSKYWVQKSSPVYSLKLLNYFDTATWVLIRRDTLDVLKSSYANQISYGGRPNILGLILENIYQNKVMDYLEKARPDAICLSYESMRKDELATARRLCQSLGVNFEKAMLKQRYRPNTSFDSEKKREETFTSGQKNLIGVICSILDLLPLAVLSAVMKVKDRNRTASHLVSGSFGRYKDKLQDQKIYG